jgi:hypothetical protein
MSHQLGLARARFVGSISALAIPALVDAGRDGMKGDCFARPCCICLEKDRCCKVIYGLHKARTSEFDAAGRYASHCYTQVAVQSGSSVIYHKPLIRRNI